MLGVTYELSLMAFLFKFVLSGNGLIHAISSSMSHELRVDLQSFDGQHAFAHYSSFSVGPESEKFVLHVANFEGTAGE